MSLAPFGKMNNKEKSLAILIGIVIFLTAGTVLAQSEAVLSFRFDDGLLSQYNYAAPILAKYGFTATEYIFTDPPEEGNWEGYMTWDQIEALHNVYGWEIGGHTKSHPYLTQLPDAQIIEELSDSKAILESHGFIIKSFASPFGDYDDRVLSYVRQYYQSHGSAWPYGFNSFPFDNYEYLVQEVRNSTSVATVKSWVDTAVLQNKWLVLLFHEIVNSNPTEYEYTKANFEAVVDYVYAKNIPVLTISQALGEYVPLPSIPLPPAPPVPLILPSGQNLILNPSFESITGDWADNWARTDSVNVSLDTNNNGSSPEPKNSLKFISTSDTTSVSTAEAIDIDPSRTYNLSAYFNCPSFTSGGVDIFIDEYDSNGNWLNWIWQTGIWNGYIGIQSAVYTPSSNTDKIFIWIEGVAGSNLTCYVDEVVLN